MAKDAKDANDGVIRPLVVAGEVLTLASVTAWVGGHAALGAFAARIAFRDLPRATASSLMTTVFRSFDKLALALVIVLAVGALLRAAGLRGAAWRGAAFVSLVAQIALVAVGAVGLAWVHPTIERLFADGDTLSPAFAAMHRLSERLGHAEVLIALVLFGSLAWARRRA